MRQRKLFVTLSAAVLFGCGSMMARPTNAGVARPFVADQKIVVTLVRWPYT